MLTLSSFSIPYRFSIDDALFELWQTSYLNLLAKHELWVEHEQVSYDLIRSVTIAVAVLPDQYGHVLL